MSADIKRARKLGAYELVERLGKGGMGEVWRAHHSLLARPAAIKLIRQDKETTERLRDRFEREAQITASLESPYTVRLFDFGFAGDGTCYYVMELLRGVDLETLVEKHGAVEPARVIHFLLQACESLSEAHRRGLVHRDIKPANLYLAQVAERFDVVKVLDFGLVRAERSEGDPASTNEDLVIGTPAFMAPEMATGDGKLDGRADIYALGCVAYYLLSGKLVFEADTPMQMAVRQVADVPKSLKDVEGVALSEQLNAVVMRCLEKSADQRYGDASDLADALRQCPEHGQWSATDAGQWWRTHIPDASIPPSRPSEQPTAVLMPLK